MLKIIQHLDKHCSCHLQCEYVMVERFWKPYIGQAVGGELNLLIGGAEERHQLSLAFSNSSFSNHPITRRDILRAIESVVK
jgi:hypothetical protein